MSVQSKEAISNAIATPGTQESMPPDVTISDDEIVAGLEAFEAQSDASNGAGAPPTPPTKQAAPPEAAETPPQEAPPPIASEEILRISKLKKDQERRFAEERQQLEKDRAAIEEQRSQMDALQKRLDRALNDPMQFYKEAGHSPIEIAKLIAAQSGLTKDAAPEQRSTMRQLELERKTTTEVEQLRQQIEEMKKASEEREQRQQLDAQVRKIKDGHQQFLTEVPESLKLVHRAAQKSPEWVKDQMFEVLVAWSQRYPDDPVPPPERVAEMLENSLAAHPLFAAQLEEQQAAVPQRATQTPPAERTAEPIPSHQLQARSGSEEWPEDVEEQNERLVRDLETLDFDAMASQWRRR